MPVIDFLSTRRTLLQRGALAVGGAVAGRSWAQAPWPSKPIRLVVPFAPGGSSEIVARAVAGEMAKTIGQNVFVDNKLGAAGNIAMQEVANSMDEHTIILGHIGTLAVNPFIFAKLPYDPLKDLAAVGTIAESPNVIVVNAASPLKTLQDLVQAAKADPAKPLNYGTAGIGSPQHLAMEQLANVAGIKIQHITYRGTSPAVADLLGGQTQFGAYSLSSMLPMIEGRKLRVLAVMTQKRTPLLPDAPSMAELGYKAVDSSIRFALFVPAATPKDVVAKLAAANDKAIADPALKEAFRKSGYDTVVASPQQTAAMVQREHDVWGPIVKQLGLRPE